MKKKNPYSSKDLGPAATITAVSRTQLFNAVRAKVDSNATNGIKVLNALNYFNMAPKEVALNEVQRGKFKFNFMALYKSQNWLYNSNYHPNWAPFYLDSKFTWNDVVAMKKELQEFADLYLVPSLRDQYHNYLVNKWAIGKYNYEVQPLVDAIFAYGVNDGDWDLSSYEKWKHFSKLFLDQTKWDIPTDQEWQPIPVQKEMDYYRTLGLNGWIEVLRRCPYLEMQDFTVSSGFNLWRPQSLNMFWEMSARSYEDAKTSNVMTLQSRTQGGTVKSDIDFKSLIQIALKVRAVLAAAKAVKDMFYPITYLWRASEPDLTHYFKDGDLVMNRVLDMVKRADLDDSLDLYNTDLKAADQTQYTKGFGWNIDYYKLKARKHFPKAIADYVSRSMIPLERPRVLVNPRQILIFPTVIAPSGHGFVPPGESASVFASHVVPVLEGQGVTTTDYDDWRNYVLDILIQLDDVQELTIKHDLEFDSKYMRKHYGSIMSVSKTNVLSEDGWVEPLKVNVGHIYNDSGLRLELLDGSDPQNGSFLKDLPPALRFDAERGTRDDGQALLMLSADDFEWGQRLKLINQYKLVMIGDKPYYLVNKAIQSLFGKLTALSSKAPVSLFHMLYRRLRGKTWDNMIMILKRAESIHIQAKDWGFGRNDKLIALLIDITERGVVNEN
jgi:hypothetical protein